MRWDKKGDFGIVPWTPFFEVLYCELNSMLYKWGRYEEGLYEGDREYNRDMRPLQPLRILVMVGDLKIYDEKLPILAQ